jgi:cytochrome c oxidase subunit IV
MSHKDFTSHHRAIGRAAAWALFVTGVVYSVTTVLGLLSLKSPQDPIGNPYVTIMELLIILTAPLYVISMITVHAYAPPEFKAYSLTALIFMILLAGLTSSVHFVVLTVARQIEATGLTWVPLFLSWKWPSVIYTLDILAWDWFFALSMLSAAPVFRGGRLERNIRTLMIVSGVLCLAGLIGVPLANMQFRNIGIIGYGLVAPVAFLLLAILFGRTQPILGETERSHSSQTEPQQPNFDIRRQKAVRQNTG